MSSSTPLFEALARRALKSVTSFHTPGHKNGRGLDPKLKSLNGKLFACDVTVFPEVDSLHDPVGAIRRAQELMAKTYKVRHSFFLVNGSTVGNQAMILAAAKPGESILLSRNIHKSVISGVILAGVWPIWIQPRVDQNLDIIFDVTPEQVQEAIRQFPEAKAVFVTSPTYNGVVGDLKRIAEICHQNGKALLVDEAHGAHLRFHPDLPASAADAGADLCVQSTHKTLTALSQGSVLHYNSKIIDFNRVRKTVSLLQTTSPNYLILASLDLARNQIEKTGRKKLERLLTWSRAARRRINSLWRFSCFTREEILSRGFDLDETKLTINATRTGLSGYEVSEALRGRYRIQVDCADLFNLIAILGLGTEEGDLVKLTRALSEIDRREQGKSKNWILQLPSLNTEMVMMPRDVFLYHSTQRIPFSQSVGHICAETLTPYPPGIPVLIPGERITKEIRDYLLDLGSKNVRISGCETETLKTIKVVR